MRWIALLLVLAFALAGCAGDAGSNASEQPTETRSAGRAIGDACADCEEQSTAEPANLTQYTLDVEEHLDTTGYPGINISINDSNDNCRHYAEGDAPWQLEGMNITLEWTSSTELSAELDLMVRVKGDTLQTAGPSPLAIEVPAGALEPGQMRISIGPTQNGATIQQEATLTVLGTYLAHQQLTSGSGFCT